MLVVILLAYELGDFYLSVFKKISTMNLTYICSRGGGDRNKCWLLYFVARLRWRSSDIRKGNIDVQVGLSLGWENSFW